MKQTTVLLVVFLLMAAGGAAAQEARTYPYKTIVYMAEDNRMLAGPEGASRRVESTFRENLSGTVREYNAAGKLLRITQYAHMEAQLRLGPETTYYENGELRTKEDYVGNKRNGEFVVYYKDGKIKRRETYLKDERKTGECFDPAGKPLPFFEYEVMPRYRGGGLVEMVRAIQQQVKYPADALRNQIEGKVYVSFAVSAAGELEGVKIVKGLSPSLDAEVMRAVNTLKGFTPGTQDGVPVTVSFTVPITFAIQ